MDRASSANLALPRCSSPDQSTPDASSWRPHGPCDYRRSDWINSGMIAWFPSWGDGDESGHLAVGPFRSHHCPVAQAFFGLNPALRSALFLTYWRVACIPIPPSHCKSDQPGSEAIQNIGNNRIIDLITQAQWTRPSGLSGIQAEPLGCEKEKNKGWGDRAHLQTGRQDPNYN